MFWARGCVDGLPWLGGVWRVILVILRLLYGFEIFLWQLRGARTEERAVMRRRNRRMSDGIDTLLDVLILPWCWTYQTWL